MNRCLLLLICYGLCLFNANKVFAQSLPLKTWQKATVKVRSYPCLTKRPLFEGSGFLVKYADKLEVLTSEHVLIHSKSANVCHEIETSEGVMQKTKLLHIAYLAGLARLQVSEGAELTSLAVELTDVVELSPMSPYVALGFPQNSDSLQTLQQGHLISQKSQRALIPSVKNILEVSDLPVEFGMSGGLLLQQIDNKGFALAGLLSHQYLRRQPLKGSQVDEYRTSGSLQGGDLTFAVSVQDLTDFLHSDIPLDDLQWLRDWQAQIEGREVLSYGPLRFSMNQSDVIDIFSIGGIARGGADGSGIGGIENISQQNIEAVQVINVEFSKAADAKLKLMDMQDGALNEWRIQKLRGVSVRIPFLRVKDQARLQDFNSMGQFLTFWKQRHFTPVAIYVSKSDTQNKLMQEAKNLLKLSQNLRKTQSNPELKAWLGLIRDQVILAQTGLITASSINNFFGPENDEYWKEFYNDQFDNAVELSAKLHELGTTMQKLGLK